jgi:hypothetical protein
MSEKSLKLQILNERRLKIQENIEKFENKTILVNEQPIQYTKTTQSPQDSSLIINFKLFFKYLLKLYI